MLTDLRFGPAQRLALVDIARVEWLGLSRCPVDVTSLASGLGGSPRLPACLACFSQGSFDAGVSTLDFTGIAEPGRAQLCCFM